MKWIFSVLLAALLLLSVTAVAITIPITTPIIIPASEKAVDRSNADASPVIDKTGGNDGDSKLELHPPGLEKKVFIHYKKGYAKPPWAGGKKENKCYDFLGRGVKWKTLPINYVIDPDNSGLAEYFVTTAISAATSEWDSHTSTQLFGTYSVVHDATWDSDAPDGRNEYLFGDYPDDNVIAVTVVWGYFYGPPQTREITEYDVLFNTRFPWGNGDVDSTVMDLQNIATHETGHGLGLDDLYDTACSEETMYGYSEYGETTKRTLNTGDIMGIQELYGA